MNKVKKIFKTFVLPIMFAILLAVLLNYPVFAENLDYTNPIVEKTVYPPQKVSEPKVEDVDLMEFIQSVAVQIIVPTTRYSRDLSWFKLEKGQIDHEKLDRNKDQWGYKWFKEGWKVEFGDWCKYDDAAEVMICGSGVILYSSILPEGLRVEGELHGATYILTNAHVVDILVDYKINNEERWGTKGEPLDVYEPEFLIEKTYPPGIKIKGDAKPYEQAYYVKKSNYITIKHSVDQLYRVEASIEAFDMTLDVALLQLNNVWGLPYAIWRGTPCRVGEVIWICGAPLALPFSIDKGRINQVGLNLGKGYGIIWDNQVKLDIPAAPGSSGSGIFDARGNLIAEEHGVLVHNGNYISGGHLAIAGMSIREWMIWNGFAFIVLQDPYGRVRALEE